MDLTPILSGGVAVLMLLAAIAIMLYRRHNKINMFWGLLAILFSGGTMLMAIVGSSVGTIYAKPSGDPRSSVTEFFDALVTGDYETAYSLMDDYSDLGLDTQPESEAGQLINQALKESYHYELVGACQVNLIQASQRVSMRYLDISAVTSQLGELTAKKLKILVQTREHDQVYDAEDNYLPEVTQEAYIQALEQALKDARSCYTTVEFDVPLKYTGGKWLVLTAPELLTALSGGTAA